MAARCDVWADGFGRVDPYVVPGDRNSGVLPGINNTAKPFKANLDDTSAGAGKSLVDSFFTAFGTQPGDLSLLNYL